MSDLSGEGENGEVVVEQGGEGVPYEEKIESLMTEVGALKAEVREKKKRERATSSFTLLPPTFLCPSPSLPPPPSLPPSLSPCSLSLPPSPSLPLSLLPPFFQVGLQKSLRNLEEKEMELSRSRASLREKEAELQVDKGMWFCWCCLWETWYNTLVMSPHSVVLTFILCRASEKNC